MCGRFIRISPLPLIVEHFQIMHIHSECTASYNIAPTQSIAAVVREGTENHLTEFRWGLIPFWAKDPAIGNRLINARAETAAEKPSFKHALKYKRCLIVADGFYEWKRAGNKKQPMLIRRQGGGPFVMAGLWDVWESPEQQKHTTCTILTTSPNSLLQSIHNRMPVILPRHSYEHWLDPHVQNPSQLLPLLQPYPDNDLEAYPVTTLVNSPENNSPECIQPL